MREEVERFEFGLAGLERGTGRLKGRTNGALSSLPRLSLSPFDIKLRLTIPWRGCRSRQRLRGPRTLGPPARPARKRHDGSAWPVCRAARVVRRRSPAPRPSSCSIFIPARYQLSFANRPYRPSNQSSSPLPPLQAHLHSLQAYAQAHHTLLALRAQKQLDVEILTEYLSSVVLERDRLAALVELGVGAGSHAGGGVGPPVGVGAWARERIEKIRGKDDVHSRRVRMGVLDGKIAEVRLSFVSRCLGITQG